MARSSQETSDERASTDPHSQLAVHAGNAPELSGKRYQWLDKNFPAGSAAIKEKKERINDYFAHANVVLTSKTFEVNEAGTWISAPFFDVEDEFHVKVDLWLTASISIEILDLLYGVNKGRDVVKFILNFESNLQRIHQAHEALVAEMKSTDRYKRAFEFLAGTASTS